MAGSRPFNKFTVMKKHIPLLILLAALLPVSRTEAQHLPVDTSDIVILYDNDVHGAIHGYPVIASFRDSLRRLTPHVTLVSNGDYLSGSVYGSISKGGYIVRMMNAVGYDIVTLGNHEFDFGIPLLSQRLAQLTASKVCCNFLSVENKRSMLDSYEIRQYGQDKVAFIGITTPTTPTSSTPDFFMDSTGHWLYTFSPNALDSLLQCRVDEVRRLGARYVILLAHIGDDDVPSIVANTTGIDAVLDGHFHSVIPHTILYNRDGRSVLWTSTGDHFKTIGQLVIDSRGDMRSELIPLDDIRVTASAVVDTFNAVRREYQHIGNRPVGHAYVPLSRTDFLPGYADCTEGNFFADAFLAVSGADIALVNSGGMRADIPAGRLVFDHLYSAAPFENNLCVIEVKGQTILDALEMACRTMPQANGGFLQVAGMTFDIDTNIRSSVVVDHNNMFVRVAGARRVKNVRVWDKAKKRYVGLNPRGRYRVVGNDYTLLKHGDGHVFANAKIINKDVCIYLQALETYVRENLKGVVGEQYAKPQGRIRLR